VSLNIHLTALVILVAFNGRSKPWKMIVYLRLMKWTGCLTIWAELRNSRTMKIEGDIVLVQDSREQLPYGPLFQTPYVIGALDCGDYSVAGLEHLISIERKSFQDLLGSLTSGRDRFEAELKTARSLHKFYILVECSPGDILVDDFGKLSRAQPRSIWGTICACSTRYAPFIFGGIRADSARLCEGLLVAYTKEFVKGQDAMRKAAAKTRKAS
jgi:DNA excision repair protein ERCC-4